MQNPEVTSKLTHEERRKFKNFLVIWIGQKFSYLGSAIVQFALIWWITEVTQSASFLSLSFFLTFVPRVLLSPLAGRFADKYDRKKLLIIADSLQAFTTFILIAAIYFRGFMVGLVLMFNTLRAIFQTFHNPVSATLVPLMVPKKKFSNINGLNQLFLSVLDLLTPAIAAFLMVFFPISIILWVDVVTFLIAFCFLIPATIPKQNQPFRNQNQIKETQSKKRRFQRITDGLELFKEIPGLGAIISVVIIANLMLTPFNALITYFVNVSHGGSEIEMAILSGCLQVGIITGSILVSLKRKWVHKTRAMFISIISLFFGIIFFGLAPNGSFYWIYIGGISITFLLPIFRTLRATITQMSVPVQKMGRFVGFFMVFNSLSMMVGYLVVGPLAELIGIVPLFISSASLAIFIITLIFLFSKIKQLEAISLEPSDYAPQKDEIPPSIKKSDQKEPIETPAP
ncbi:MAG: MFS transporter [Asgard group archaeon]|nr:MFS transporter [Asgard group archaeon]